MRLRSYSTSFNALPGDRPKLESRGDQPETAELIPGSGIIVRHFEPTRSNPWHQAPRPYTVDIEIGDGTVRRLGPGDILIAEDLTGQGHATREVRPEARVSVRAAALASCSGSTQPKAPLPRVIIAGNSKGSSSDGWSAPQSSAHAESLS